LNTQTGKTLDAGTSKKCQPDSGEVLFKKMAPNWTAVVSQEFQLTRINEIDDV
jgi:hypothetical protein